MRGVAEAIAQWSDRRLAALLAAAFFTSFVFPILWLEVPPYQDLPGHLATAAVIAHPDRYPGFVAAGWTRSNMALLAFTYFAGNAVGIKLAARLFILGTLGMTAAVLPRFVLHFTDRRRMLIAAPLVWPMVHNWFLSMGMLNFALGFALALAMLVGLDRQRTAPTPARSALLAILGVACWYASSVPLLAVGVLVGVEIVGRSSWHERIKSAKRLALPLIPAGVLVAIVAVRHATETGGGHYGAVEAAASESNVQLLYDAWAHWFYAFTEIEAVTLLPAVVLAAYAVARFRHRVPFFSRGAMGALVALCLLLPFMLPGFGFVNERFLPMLWAGALVRVPSSMPRPLIAALVLAGAINAVGIDVDLFRLAADQDEYAAGMASVPEGSRLLALTFRTRTTSRNTWSLRHASGLYVVDRMTSAQDVWADSPTMALRFRETPTFLEDEVQVERFVATVASRADYCEAQRVRGLPTDRCEDEWRAQWDWLWRQAAGQIDRVLLFAPTVDALSTIPPTFRPCFRKGALLIVEPVPPTETSRP